jgi:hypothetical protein
MIQYENQETLTRKIALLKKNSIETQSFQEEGKTAA